MTYVNKTEEQPIEVTFEFPLTDKSSVTKLSAQIGDKLIEAQIKEKEEAKEKYDDAMAAGNTAILGTQDEKKKDSMTLRLGNLLPGQTAVLSMCITEEVEIVGGAYSYSLPASLLPDLKKHSKDKVDGAYAINYEFDVRSSQKITYFSAPKGTAVKFSDDRTHATLSGGKWAREIRFFYRSAQMMQPTLLFEESPQHPD